jgi:hypothetical protein
VNSGEIRHRIAIDCSVRTVFGYVADPRNLQLWSASVRRCEQIYLKGPACGARYRLIRPYGAVWRPTASTLETIEYLPHRRLAWRRIEGDGIVDVQCDLAPLALGTLVSLEERFRVDQTRPIGALDLRLRRYRLPRDLWRLKQLIEASPLNPSSPAVGATASSP